VAPDGASPPVYVPEVQGYLFTGFEGNPGIPDLFLWLPLTEERVVRITSTSDIGELSPATRK